MPKTEITAESDFSAESYKEALKQAQNRMDTLEAERDKAVADLKLLKAKLDDSLTAYANIFKANDALRVANIEYQKELVALKDKLAQKEAEEAERTESAESILEDMDCDCDGNCTTCDHSIAEDTEVDEQIDYLIRENLDLEGQKKGLLDALHLLCGWLRWSNDVEGSK